MIRSTMKAYKLIIFMSILGLLFSSFSSADENLPDYKEFIDIVYEWTPNGSMIQVGDYTISDIKSVWLDNGNENIVNVSTSYINQGELAKAVLITQDDNGFWIADKIIVFSGKGLDTVIKTLPLIKKKELLKILN